ncbi:MAG: ABC transporter permease [Acidimicrobiales bacterium]
MVPHAPTLTRPIGAGLVWELVLRNLRLRYRRSALGLLWAQLAPLAYVVVLTIVFTRVVPLDIEHYPVFVLLGMLPWLWFQAALVAGTTSVVYSPDLLRQPGFPRLVLPLVAVASTLAHHVLALPVALAAGAIVTGRLSVTALAVVPLLAVQFLLCSGPAFALACLHARLRDTAHLLSVLLIPCFYATPVLYDATALDAVPALRLNPMAPIVDGYRDAVLRGTWPPVGPLLVVTGAGLVLLIGGLSLYRARMPRFVEDL